MKLRVIYTGLLLAALSAAATRVVSAAADYGLFVQILMRQHALELFGVSHLDQSALGPFNGADSTQAVTFSPNLQVTLVSSAVNPLADQIALWPDDLHPTHLYVCVEGGATGPAVQRVDLSQPANANATTILTGMISCDPIRRTPWGTIVAGEETSDGGWYELMNPASITTNVRITDRAAGATTDARVVKRKVVGSLAFEGQVILADGTMYYGDELRPGAGAPGGGMYKFVPDFPYSGGGPITDPTLSPFASGRVYGLRVGNANDYGQGSEIGYGVWTAVPAATYVDANGNINLRKAQGDLKFTGYYRPEDMDMDPIAAGRGQVRVCWTNTGRMSNGGGSIVETSAIYGEVMCLNDEPSGSAATGANPKVTRFIAGNPQANFFDNVSFQPRTGNLVVLEDGEMEVVGLDRNTVLRGNDLWMCLPDGLDEDVQSDGCVRFMSLRDTTSEPTGFVFDATGETAYVNLQHRGVGTGALLKITGFQIH